MEISPAVTKDISDDRDPNSAPLLSSSGRSGRRGRAKRRPDLFDEGTGKGKKRPDSEEEEESPSTERSPSRGGDLFQLYLHQMTEIRLLPREEELWLAKQIDHHRKRLRAKLFESPAALA